MSQLSVLQPEEQELVVSLLYKVGVWMSHTDDEDGEQDDVQEMSALEAVILSVAKLNDTSVFVQEVARETMRQRSQWESWSYGCFDIVPDCEKAVAILKGHVSEADLKSYKKLLVEIATVVAEAYGEFGEFDGEDRSGAFGGLVSKITGKFAGLSDKDKNHPMNISAAEDSALSSLAEAMRS